MPFLRYTSEVQGHIELEGEIWGTNRSSQIVQNCCCHLANTNVECWVDGNSAFTELVGCLSSLLDCEQVEHGVDRADDVLPRGGRQHAGAAGPAGEV